MKRPSSEPQCFILGSYIYTIAVFPTTAECGVGPFFPSIGVFIYVSTTPSAVRGWPDSARYPVGMMCDIGGLLAGMLDISA